MKKVLASVLVLALLAPAIGLLCFCCPALAAAESSSTSVIVSRDCSCCESKEFKRDQGLFEKFENAGSLLVRTLLLRFIPADSNVIVPRVEDREAPLIFGPPVFPHTPLYLSLEILRL